MHLSRSSSKKCGVARLFLFLAVAALALDGCDESAVTHSTIPVTAQNNSGARVRLPVDVGGKRGYIDDKGNLVIKTQYEESGQFHEGLAQVCVGNCEIMHRMKSSEVPGHRDYKFGFIDEDGKLIVNPRFDSVTDFSEGLAAVCIGDDCNFSSHTGDRKWGYIDKTGATIIPSQFDSAAAFKEGLAAVDVGGKYGYINESGKFVIDPQFDGAFDFQNGIAWVQLRTNGSDIPNAAGYIDKTGKYIWKPSN
jgi:hypothetical protein